MANNILAQTDVKMVDIQPIGYHQLCSLSVRSTIMNRQNYDAVTKLFTPNYEMSPLVIFPECRLLDPDSPVESILANSTLRSFTWEEVTSSKTSVIATEGGASDSTKYEVATTGDSKGQITVKCNSTIGIRRSLRFIGIWIDKVSGYRYTFSKDIPLIVEDVTDATASITLDMPNTDKWNPFRQQATRDIHALVKVGRYDKTDDANTKLFWYRINSAKSKILIKDVDDEDNWEITSVIKGTNGQITSISVDRDKMGDGVSYEVYCSYRVNGSLPDAPESGDPKATTSLVRCFPKIEAQFTGANARVQGSNTSILLKAIVSDNMGEIPNWNDIAYANWYEVTSSTDKDGNIVLSRALLGSGPEILVSTDVAKRVQLDILDRGATVALVDDEENHLMDDDAALIETPIIV